MAILLKRSQDESNETYSIQKKRQHRNYKRESNDEVFIELKYAFVNIIIKIMSFCELRKIKSSLSFLIKNEILHICETLLSFIYNKELIDLVFF